METTPEAVAAEPIAEPLGLRLPDLIREGSAFTVQASGWGRDERACALSAAALALEWRALGVLFE